MNIQGSPRPNLLPSLPGRSGLTQTQNFPPPQKPKKKKFVNPKDKSKFDDSSVLADWVDSSSVEDPNSRTQAPFPTGMPQSTVVNVQPSQPVPTGNLNFRVGPPPPKPGKQITKLGSYEGH